MNMMQYENNFPKKRFLKALGYLNNPLSSPQLFYWLIDGVISHFVQKINHEKWVMTIIIPWQRSHTYTFTQMQSL